MKKPVRVYVDTSVVGGCCDPEFADHSRRLFRLAGAGHVRLLVSEMVLRELEAAPVSVRSYLLGLPTGAVETVPLSREIFELADKYIQAGILTEKSADDATHVAAATVARADAIASWNFRHIVCLDKMKAYNRVNILEGYGVLTIVTPGEVFEDDRENV